MIEATGSGPLTDQRIVVTGLGIVSPLGHGSSELGAALRAGRDGIGAIGHFSDTPFAGARGGALPRRRFPHPRGEAAIEFGASALLEALSESGPAQPGERVALIVGTTMASKERPLDVFADDLRRAVGLPDALVLMISTACTSGADAIAFGAELLRMGSVDRVLAGGTDEIDLKAFAGFHALKLLAPTRCTPFGSTVGTTLGEGAAFLCLEQASDAAKRGHHVRAVLEGWASTADAFHATSPHPSGDGLTRAAESALAAAGRTQLDVDWVSAHGTGTVANDAAESLAIDRIFEGRAVPVTALKSLVGHTLGAAGAVELALSIVALEIETVPATVAVEAVRPGCSIDLVRSPRPSSASRVLKLSAAFGGVNSATIVARRLEAETPRPRARRAVFVAGAGALGGAALGSDPFGEVDQLDLAVPAFALEELVPGVEARGLDAVSRFLITASVRALANAGLDIEAIASARTGIFVGQLAVSPTSHLEFDESALARGVARVSASAFTRKVLNAATGATSRALSLRGPTTTLSAGLGSGLVAAVLAAERLAGSDEADVVLAGAAHERDASAREVPGGEGAVVIALASAAGLKRAPVARIVRWALAGPGERGALVERMAPCAASPAALFEATTSPGSAPSVGGLLALGRALRAIERHETSAALVLEEGPLVTAAVILERAHAEVRHAS